MNEADRIFRQLTENFDYLSRAPSVFPSRRDMASLRARAERGDPNVVVYFDEEGRPERYELEFTKTQREALEAAYKAVRPKPEGNPWFDADYEARVFVGIIEHYGDAIETWAAIKTPDQKTRVRTIRSFINAVEKFDAALADMDSAALGWLYAVIVDRLAAAGVQVSQGDDAIVSMRDHPMRAQIEAGELRHEIRRVAGAIVEAADEACGTLPVHDFAENDVRLKVALWLERQVLDHRIEFDTSETGFPAQCLRAVFDLGGVDSERVSYWLKKAAAHPDSFGQFLARQKA